LGEQLPLILATVLSVMVVIVWYMKGAGKRKKRVYLLLLALGGVATAWLWAIPNIYVSKNWEAFMAFSYFLVLIPLVIPSFWKKYAKTIKNT